MKPIAVDFETSWTKDRSIGTHGTFNYLSHPETKIFMVAIYGDGVSYVGEPEDAPWDEVRGNLVIAHNYTFEHAVFRECERRGIIKEPLNETGFCTADMSAYLQAPRNLLGAARELLGVSLDKTTRDKFKGKDFDTLPIDIQLEISNYALMDAKACFHLYKRYHHLWPEHEQKLSDHTRLMGRRGVGLDVDAVRNGIQHLKQVLWEVEKQIPWSSEAPIMSIPAMHAACRKANIPAPESTAKNNESFQVWSQEYADKVPFVASLARYRSVNRTLAVLEAMEARQKDGSLQFGLKYYGAHTGRWSGDSGYNIQNQKKGEVEGINLRQCLIARPGKKLVVADYSQIEARVSLFYAQDHERLEMVRNGMCLYEAAARRSLGYDLPIPLKEAAKKDPKWGDLRQFSKARELSLGFGVGKDKFRSYAKTVAGIDLTSEEAEKAVREWRASNPAFPKLWSKLEQGMRMSRNDTFELELPSGRVLRYFEVANMNGLTAKTERGGIRLHFYGAKIFENLVQATARCLFAEAILRIESAGFPVVFHCHDEIVVEVPEEDAGQSQKEIERLMCITPEWASTLPVGVESQLSDRYEK